MEVDSQNPAIPETKECPGCDQVIGKSEKVCPKCGLDQEEIEQHLTELQRAQEILRKRRKKTATKPVTEPVTEPVTPAAKKKTLFSGLLALRKAK